MRIILVFGFVLGALWSGYWLVGSRLIEAGVGQWVADMRMQGLAIDEDGIAVSGFPSRFDLTVTRPHLSDLAIGWGWKAPFAQVLSMTWKPWHVIAVLPQDQVIVGPDQTVSLTTRKMQGSLRLQPSADLTLEEVRIEARNLTARSDLGWQFDVGSAVLALARDENVQFGQRLGLEMTDLRPDTQFARLVPGLGEAITSVHLDGTVNFSAPLDRHVGATAPYVTGITLKGFHLIWGSLDLTAKGSVAPGLDGLAAGQIDFRIQGWQQVPALAVALGIIRREMGDSLTDGLEVLARSGGNPDVLTLPLVFADGWMTLGPIPLGPAPVFVQRQ